MSRKYLNERWCVRCGRKTPSPYLKKNVKLLNGKTVLDIGCGNGRNSEFMVSLGYDVTGIDMTADIDCKVRCKPIALGEERIPMDDGSVDIVLANYIFMFLSKNEIEETIKEIHRLTHDGSFLMIELYPAKDSFYSTQKHCDDLLECLYIEFWDQNGWEVVRKSKNRMILKKENI